MNPGDVGAAPPNNSELEEDEGDDVEYVLNKKDENIVHSRWGQNRWR